ncbi:protein disulfide [Lophiostoma macrostomum CBS 122681]|uniref:Protein disulfide n=1 Tax=Lophiostoma macrostomum CBS 122681 TaxID=1314788 RepID=A0A6A6SS19_9PLEO|nr:protein disulfide [Lophiostoma macrostomum CBS 122681]
MTTPTLEFNYDISCPFAYIASTRITSLASRITANLHWRPVLLGAIYRATSAPQGAAGSASDVFNPTKKAVTARSMRRTLKRYNVPYNPPPQHPRKTVDALRLLYFVDEEQGQRERLTHALFRAYWVEGRDVADRRVLLEVGRECGVEGAEGWTEEVFKDTAARARLEEETGKAIARGAFGVPGFWVPEVGWRDFQGERNVGRFYWGQDRMHFVEADLLAMRCGYAGEWRHVQGLKSLVPRCTTTNRLSWRVRVDFWYDFSSPWAFLGWTQLPRLQRMFGEKLEIVLKPFLLGILFREIGAPNLPASAASAQKAIYSRQDHADWVRFWNSVNEQEGRPDKAIEFHWADVFPIRTPTVLRCAIVEPACVPFLYRACWEKNSNVADDSVLTTVLNDAGFDGVDIVRRSAEQEIKEKLRSLTAEAKEVGICGVPSYRVFHEDKAGGWTDVSGVIWGQDELSVVEDVIAGWNSNEGDSPTAEPEKSGNMPLKESRL